MRANRRRSHHSTSGAKAPEEGDAPSARLKPCPSESKRLSAGKNCCEGEGPCGGKGLCAGEGSCESKCTFVDSDERVRKPPVSADQPRAAAGAGIGPSVNLPRRIAPVGF